MSDASPAAVLASWLRQCHNEISACEEQARTALYADKDEQSYRALMRKKAELLVGMSEQSTDMVTALPEPLRREAANRLYKFSAGAQNALSLDSVFYMAALLYPDDYQQGQPNNLERLIDQLAS